MNTIKEKVEAYVRSQIPELMELSDGCVLALKYRSMFHDEGGGEKWNDIETQHTGIIYEGRLIGKDYEITDYDNLTTNDFVNGVYVVDEGSVEETRVEIIGHPIQLHHWLRVLEEYENQWNYTMCLEKKQLWLGAGKIKFNLSTGQPATTGDYQAIAELLNIEV